jgi:hypothetical protein
MRTTLTIDDDLAGILHKKASEQGLSFKETVNRVLRQGLAEAPEPSKRPVVKTRPHAFGFRSGIDLDRLNQLVDELEVIAFRDQHLKKADDSAGY